MAELVVYEAGSGSEEKIEVSEGRGAEGHYDGRSGYGLGICNLLGGW